MISKKNIFYALLYLSETIILAILFTGLQFFEYNELSFTITDSIYGSTFYMLTGLHGSHVICGTLCIIGNYIRILLGHFYKSHHIGFLCCA